ncbi:MAG: hypothetical protein PHO23_02505 [Candidatus Pacebacteria bacterium]|nr:hypothetical protein [Candidatus Paceibacterota bacterium]
MICPDCNTIVKCEKCNTPLSINKTQKKLICPSCNSKIDIPNKCPNCNNILLETIGFGIDKIKKELDNYLILTKDTKNKQEIIQKFNETNKHLIGTQVIFDPNIINTDLVVSLSLDHLFIFPE